MSISDLINILAITIAIVALVNERNRYLLLWKFNILERLILAFFLLLINFLVFFENYSVDLKKSFPKIFKPFLCINCGLYSKDWAYIVFFITILFVFIKITYGFFSNRNRSDLLKYYQKLINFNETSTFVSFFEKYHLNPIIKDYTQNLKESELVANDTDEYIRRIWPERDREDLLTQIKNLYNKIRINILNDSFDNKKNISFSVWSNIIFSEQYLPKIIATDPFLLPPIFRYFRSNQESYYSKEIVQEYYYNVINNNNAFFNKELKDSLNFTNQPQPKHFYEDNIIIASILEDPEVAVNCNLSKTVLSLLSGDVKAQSFNAITSTLLQENRFEDDDLWGLISYRAYVFNNLITWEILAKDSQVEHWFLLNYKYLSDDLLKRIFSKIDNTTLVEEEIINLNAVRFHEKILNETLNILDYCFEKNLCSSIYTVVGNLSSMVYSMSMSEAYPTATLQNLLDRIFRVYCDLYKIKVEFKDEIEMKCYDDVMELLTKLLLKPNQYHSNPDKYLNSIEYTWSKFDRIPYRHTGVNDAQLQKLIDKVIKPMGLDIDLY